MGVKPKRQRLYKRSKLNHVARSPDSGDQRDAICDPPPRRAARRRGGGGRNTDLELATWNTCSYIARTDSYIQSELKHKDVLVLTECAAIHKFPRAGLILADENGSCKMGGKALVEKWRRRRT